MTINEFRGWWKVRAIRQADEAYADRPPHWQSCRAMTIADGITRGEKFWRKHRKFLAGLTLTEWTDRVQKREALR